MKYVDSRGEKSKAEGKHLEAIIPEIYDRYGPYG
jgi:hypothetical protein